MTGAANLATAAAVVVGKDGTTAFYPGTAEMLLTPSLSAADKYLPNSSWLVARVNPTAPLDAALFYEWVF